MAAKVSAKSVEVLYRFAPATVNVRMARHRQRMTGEPLTPRTAQEYVHAAWHRVCVQSLQGSSEWSRVMCHKRRVLVVEDTPALRSLLVLALTEEGYTVHAAVHGAHA